MQAFSKITFSLLTSACLVTLNFSIASASPLNKKEILSILVNSSKTNSHSTKKVYRKKVKKTERKTQPKKTIATSSPVMPKMENSPYQASSKKIEYPINVRTKKDTLEVGKLPNIKPNRITASRNIYAQKINHPKIQKIEFDSSNYLNILF